MYDDDIKQSGARIDYHLLETNRVCDMNGSNFHVSYTLLFGATNNLLNGLCLDTSIVYQVSLWMHSSFDVFLKSFDCTNVLAFQYLPDKDIMLRCHDKTIWHSKFDLLDNSLSKLKFTADNKRTIYIILSAILNLGNVRFTSTTNDDSCCISIESRKFLYNAASLMNVNEIELESALISYTREFGHQQIKYFLQFFERTFF